MSLKCIRALHPIQLMSQLLAAETQLHGKDQLPLDQGVFHPPFLIWKLDSCPVAWPSQKKAVR